MRIEEMERKARELLKTIDPEALHHQNFYTKIDDDWAPSEGLSRIRIETEKLLLFCIFKGGKLKEYSVYLEEA